MNINHYIDHCLKHRVKAKRKHHTANEITERADPVDGGGSRYQLHSYQHIREEYVEERSFHFCKE